jgi:CheY-like chemotaxis protein
VGIRKRVLIVDDDEDLTWGIAKNLAKENNKFEVQCVNSGDQALNLMKKKSFDLIVSDIRMPGRDGLQLILDVKKKYPATKVIIMTAYGSQEVQEEADKCGSFFYIEKPFEIGYLKQLISQALNLYLSGFKGYLYSSGIRELVEFHCTSKRTSSLMVSKDREQGKIYFKNGEIIHAECGNLIGERALFNILNWGRGTFKITPDVFRIKRTILRDWKTLLHQSI